MISIFAEFVKLMSFVDDLAKITHCLLKIVLSDLLADLKYCLNFYIFF